MLAFQLNIFVLLLICWFYNLIFSNDSFYAVFLTKYFQMILGFSTRYFRMISFFAGVIPKYFQMNLFYWLYNKIISTFCCFFSWFFICWCYNTIFSNNSFFVFSHKYFRMIPSLLAFQHNIFEWFLFCWFFNSILSNVSFCISF